MELEQSLDLTYVKLEEMKKKLDELDENVESVYEGINGETLNTINSKVDSVTNVTNTIKTNIDNLQGDVSEIKENANNNSNINEIKTNVDDIKTSVETIKTSSENLGTIKDDVTNIKGNVNTINTNSGTIKTDVESVKSIVENLQTDLDNLDTKSTNIKTNVDNIITNNTSISNKVDGIDEKINEIKTKVENSSTPEDMATNTELSNKTNQIIGTSDVDLTKIYEKIENVKNLNDELYNYLNENKRPKEFQADPFKLDETYTEYVKNGETYQTSDYIQCNSLFTLGSTSGNTDGILEIFGVSCEDETFDLKFTADFEYNIKSKLIFTFLNTTFGTENLDYYIYNFPNSGRNIVSVTINGIKTLESGNFIKITAPQHLILNSYKIEVFGKNIQIITKRRKYKVFCKWDETLIAKIENDNAYSLSLKTSTLNPVDLERDYTLEYEGAKEFSIVRSSAGNSDCGFPSYLCKSVVNLSGTIYEQIETSPWVDSRSGFMITNHCLDTKINGAENFKVFTLNYKSGNMRIEYNTNGMTNMTSFYTLQPSVNIAADFCYVYDQYRAYSLSSYNVNFVITKPNGMNVLQLRQDSIVSDLNLGFGKNVTAFKDKENENIINVYMKVADKMVKKVVQYSIDTDENNNIIKTMTILEQKVIGTYDYYYETKTNVYLVVKDDILYMFKK